MSADDDALECLWLIIACFGIGTMVYHFNLVLGLLQIIAGKD